MPAPHVLVVDDEESVRRLVARVLGAAGYEVATAGDGPEAIAAAEAMSAVDLLVTDLMMPQMRGDELARRIREREPGVKVLYMSGFAEHVKKSALREGEAFVGKPCSIASLRAAVERLCCANGESAPQPPRVCISR